VVNDSFPVPASQFRRPGHKHAREFFNWTGCRTRHLEKSHSATNRHGSETWLPCHGARIAIARLVSWFRSSQYLDIKLNANFETKTAPGIK
jgi:hypothetical protein